jgi:hypothetical protein
VRKTFFILLLAIITSTNFFFSPASTRGHASEVEQFFRQGLDTAVNKLLILEAAVQNKKTTNFFDKVF